MILELFPLFIAWIQFRAVSMKYNTNLGFNIQFLWNCTTFIWTEEAELVLYYLGEESLAYFAGHNNSSHLELYLYHSFNIKQWELYRVLPGEYDMTW